MEHSVLPAIVMEKMQQSLRNLVEKYVNIPWNVKFSILNDVCCGLRYLHSKNPPIVHCDLTPNNILLGGHLEAKITDIGIAKLLHSDNNIIIDNSMLSFIPPEALGQNPTCVTSFDIFSFGGIILYTVTQLWPELTNQTSEVMTGVTNRNHLLDKIVGDATALKPLVIACLDDNPENRPSMTQVSVVIKEAKERYSLKCKDDEKDPVVWLTKVLRSQQTQEKQKEPQQQEVCTCVCMLIYHGPSIYIPICIKYFNGRAKTNHFNDVHW